jgi:erythronate-4-phosphate dehydrogenase
MGTVMSVQAISRFFNMKLDNWMPDNIPSVPDNQIKIDCKEMSVQKVVNRAITATYNIQNDSDRLKKSPNTFEAQRGNYPLRREFHAYEVYLKNTKSNISQLLNNLGFIIK